MSATPKDMPDDELNAAVAREVKGWTRDGAFRDVWREECWCREDGTFARSVADWSPCSDVPMYRAVVDVQLPNYTAIVAERNLGR